MTALPSQPKVAMVHVFILIISVVLVLCDKDGLYSLKDDVVTLDANSFETSVLKAKQPDVIWIVEFYNSWCGHCIHFAPTYKKLATEFKDEGYCIPFGSKYLVHLTSIEDEDCHGMAIICALGSLLNSEHLIRNWRDKLVISAVDCSETINLVICRDFDIKAYPTMKIFPPVNTEERLNHLGVIDTQELMLIKGQIMKYLTEHTPKSWPRLRPLDKIEDLWDEKKDFHKYVTLIFEEDQSPVARQVILDMRNTPNVLVRRMLKNEVAKFGITKFPSLYRVNDDSTYSVLAIGNKMAVEDRTLFVNVLKVLSEGQEDQLAVAMKARPQATNSDGEILTNQADDGNDLLFKAKYNSSVVSMQDLESALHYSFRQEVAICKTVDGDKLVALKKFVDVLQKYFPGRQPVKGFLSKVYKMLINLATDSISGEEWMDKIDRLQDRGHFLPEVIKWETCQGSSPRYRGYPCSMWTLFHTLTVSAYTQNAGPRSGNPQEVLLAIRGYMEHFFGCQECSTNFLKMAKGVEEEVRDSKSSVMWLWSAHNKANKRLHGDESEDPKFPKIQFPSDKVCPKCHTLTKSDTEGMKISWDPDKVFAFLLKFYSEKNIVLPTHLQTADQVMSDLETGPVERMSSEHQELDWWEKKQRAQDLKQVSLLRERKKERRKELQGEERQRELQGAVIRRDLDDTQMSGTKGRQSKSERQQFAQMLGLSELDMSMCVAFYLVSTVVILVLYHHFIVRRRMMPCKRTGSLPL